MARSRHRLTKMITLRGFASQGVLAWANDAAYAFDFPANAARFTDRPSGNVITAPEDFSNAAWTKTDTTITANAETAPDGTLTADLATEGSAGTAQVGQGVTVSSGATVAISAFLKRGNTDWVRVTCINASNFFRAWFNLGTGAVGTSGAGGTGILIGASITASANGFYRVTLTGSIPATTSYSVFFNTASADNSATRVANGTYYPWGVRVEEGSVAADYLKREARYYALASVPGWTFSRASAGYALNNAGQLVVFASGAPRITDRGFLAEGARTNLCLQSQTFDNASWAKARCSITANAAVAPDGTMTADKLVEDTSSNTHILSINNAAGSATYSYSIYAKAAERSIIRFRDSVNNLHAYFDLLNGTISGAGGCTASIEALANGWYRCVLVSSIAVATPEMGIRLGVAGPSDNYQGDGTSGIYVWGAQLEAASFPSSYIPTTTASVTRAADRLYIDGYTGANQYTVFAEWVGTQNQGSTSVAFALENANTNNDCARVGPSSAGSAGRSDVRAVSAAVAGFTVGTFALSALIKGALRVSLDNMNAAYNGTLGTDDTSAAMPTNISRINFGYNNQNGLALEGYIRRCALFERALTNAELQAITAT